MADPTIANADQSGAWNEGMGKAWAQNSDALDLQLRPIGHAAMAAAGVKTGESILDVGCGCGQTTFDLASRTGANGSVLGLDISALLIGAAMKTAERSGVANVKFEIADAQTSHLGSGVYDLIFSRFGMMFFDDPVAAFSNLRGALKPNGRIAFCCWREPAANPVMTLPMQIASELLPQSDAPPADAPGPFAFADGRRVKQILEDAGFRAASVQQLDLKASAGDMATSLDLAVGVGPLGRRLRELEGGDALKSAIRTKVAAAFEQHQDANGNVMLDASAWIVRAENG